VNAVVHLELHTTDRDGASALYSQLCGWEAEQIETRSGAYLALELGSCGGGIVECGTPRSLWLPYVEVDCVGSATEHAQQLGARVLLSPREGPAGWRSVVATTEGAEIAFWTPKARRPARMMGE
jgi:predicted enzyme related to lactoylglutathione lyase